MRELIIKYKHVWVLSYFIIYLVWFFALEKLVVDYHPVYIKLDDLIPFNEWFAIPYTIWFAYIFITVAFLFFNSVQDFYKCTSFLFVGMTICLIIYTIWPNGQNLRPNLDTLGRDNILIDLVRLFYSNDTSTNVCPSIHVFNSIGAHIAISRNATLKRYKWITPLSFILMVLICLSTVFLKQHSAFDIIAGVLLGFVMYIFVYARSDYKQPKPIKEIEKLIH